jgi:hypothetical protein
MLFAATPNDGSQSWTVSGPITSQALVRIANANGSNCSAASFAIAAALTGSMSLNGGAAYTPSAAVTINSSVAGVSEMRFRYVGDSWSGWQPYAAGAAWTLPAGDGTQTVEAQYRDANANVLPLSDSIVEDMTPPETTDNSDAQTFGSFRLVLTPSDDTSGAAAPGRRAEACCSASTGSGTVGRPSGPAATPSSTTPRTPPATPSRSRAALSRCSTRPSRAADRRRDATRPLAAIVHG